MKKHQILQKRVIVYIDGFNLYYGLKSKNWQQYYWLDLQCFAENLLLSNQELVKICYFTTHISSFNDINKAKRQIIYLEALKTLSNLSIHYGRYLSKNRQCLKCGAEWITYEEKMTDVNIAVSLLIDAQNDKFDTAIIVSGDSDLYTLVRAVRKRYEKKRIIIAFPPDRHSVQLCKIATASFTVGRKIFKDSQLPDKITKPDGFVLCRPTEWS